MIGLFIARRVTGPIDVEDIFSTEPQMIKYLLVIISVISILGCTTASRNHDRKRVNFERFVQLEVQQYSDSKKLSESLHLISKETDPSVRLDQIKLWISENRNSYNAAALVTKKRQPHLWIKLNWLAAEAYRKLYSIEWENDYIDKAIAHYENIIHTLQREKHPLEWAAVRNNLANTLISLPNHKSDKQLERVIELTEEALQIRTQYKFPTEWAKTQIIRAKAYHKRSVGDKNSNLQLSANLFEQALNVQTQKAFPSDFLVTAYELSLVLLELKQYSKALSYIERALEVNERELFQRDIKSTKEKYLVSQAHSLFANAVWAHVQLKNFSAALQMMEKGKSRLLKKNFSHDLFTPNKGPSTSDIYHWLSSLPSNSAIVVPIFSDQGTVVFILKPGITDVDENNVISFNGFTRKDLYELMRGSRSDEWGGYLLSYSRLKSILIATNSGLKENKALKSQRHKWDDDVTNIFNALSNSWFDSTLSHLQRLDIKLGSRLIWILDSDTSLLPINSIIFNGEPLLASYNVQFVPSIYSAFVAQENTKREKVDHINLVINPTNDLPGTITENKLIQKHFSSRSELIGSQATIENFEQFIKHNPAAYLHVASHGLYDFKNPSQSGLVLAGKKIFSIEKISNIPRNQLHANRLVVLSACETNFVDISMPFESFGVPAAFLQAGAPAVISTLWLVDDAATMLIMAKFYEFHRELGLDPVVALAKSQLWLRSATYGEIEEILSDYWSKEEINNYWKKSNNVNKNFADRYFWAGFVYTGM